MLSYAKSLKNARKDKNEGLYNRLQPIEEEARRVLTYTASKFPYYTPHSFLHSQNVEDILNWLVLDETKSRMNDYEIFFLLVAAWFHDWGMVASASENPEEVRKLHHIRTEENFEKLHDKVHLSLNEARVIGQICRGHRDEDLLGQEYDDSYFGSNILIRIRFLAALLRIADECDVTYNRTPEIIYYTLKPEGASDEEFQKHLSIPGIGKPAPHKLVLSGVAKTPKGVEVIERVQKQIQRQLDSVKTILAANGIMLDMVEPQIVTRGFINRPIAFELERKAIVDLLIGRSLYSREDVTLRELLQNAVDTCRLKKTIDSSYQPTIEIEFDREHISFRDNGLGMSFEDASDYFSKKGSSFYVSKDLEQTLKGKEFDPISKFGIGVLSSFLIANKMTVHTKKDNHAPCQFNITDLSEGWTYEEGAKRESGTEISIFLNEKGKKLDFVNSLEHYAKNVEIPISIKNLETGEAHKLEQKWDHEIPEVLALVHRDAVDRFLESKPMLTISSALPAIEVAFHVFEGSYFDKKNCFILNHGIYVGNFDLFPAHNSCWVALINLKSSMVDLTVSRENIVPGDKFLQFLRTLYDTLLSAINQHTIEKHPEDTDIKKCARFSTNLHLFFRDSFGEELDDPKSSFLPRLFAQRNYPVISREGQSFLTWENIVKGKFSKIVHYRMPVRHYSEHIDTINEIIAPTMKDGELLVFDMGPHLQFIKQPHKFVCGFCETFKSNNEGSIECCRLTDIVAHMEFHRENTDLDTMLPSGSFFTRMPRNLKGIVVQVTPFKFTPSPDTVTSSESTFLLLYCNLVARELFNATPELGKFYDAQLWNSERDIKLVSTGKFVYDISDEFLTFLNSKADVILSNKALKNLTERYLKLVLILYLSPQYKYRPREEEILITLLEKTIADVLDYPREYLTLHKRAGILSSVYNLEEVF